MNTRSSASHLISPTSNPERIIRQTRVPISTVEDMEQNGQPPPVEVANGGQPMPDLRPMAELLQAPIEGVGDAIVVPAILAHQFEIKIGLLNLVQSISFHGFENDDPHGHIRRFTKITETIRVNQVPHDVIKMILFPFSLEGAARTWLEKEPPNSIHTWGDLVSKFINHSC